MTSTTHLRTMAEPVAYSGPGQRRAVGERFALAVARGDADVAARPGDAPGSVEIRVVPRGGRRDVAIVTVVTASGELGAIEIEPLQGDGR